MGRVDWMADAYRLSGMSTLVTAPAVEPITTTEAKLHLRVDVAADDTLIDRLIEAARQTIEQHLGRALITQTWDYVIDAPPCGDAPLLVPRVPLLGVTSITSYSTANVGTVFSSSKYLVDTASEPGRIVLNNGFDWPDDDLREANAIIVRYTAGYGSAPGAVPAALKHAMLLLMGHWYTHREAVTIGNITTVLPWAVEALTAPYKRVWL